MKAPASFEYSGLYRVQGKSRAGESQLRGRWINLKEASSDQMNRILARDLDWRGSATVSMLAADIEFRSGQFEDEPDILYKRTHFAPGGDSPQMAVDIVDVLKAELLWKSRFQYLGSCIDRDTLDMLSDIVDDVRLISALEYFTHEAGHCIGYSASDKYEDGYFRLNRKTLWPLVYVEELRADLLSFGIAVENFSSIIAAKIFWYNVLLRLGTHIEHMSKFGAEPYGSIPFMLFACMFRCGLIDVSKSLERGAFQFSELSADATNRAMASMAALARRELVERVSCSPSDAAVGAARFYHAIHHGDADFAALFDKLVSPEPGTSKP